MTDRIAALIDKLLALDAAADDTRCLDELCGRIHYYGVHDEESKAIKRAKAIGRNILRPYALALVALLENDHRGCSEEAACQEALAAAEQVEKG